MVGLIGTDPAYHHRSAGPLEQGAVGLIAVFVQGDVARLDELFGLEQHGGVLDHVLELPDIAPPGARAQMRNARFAEPGTPIGHLAVAIPVVRQEMIGQKGNVFLPFAKRRQGDRHDPKPVEEIAPENAALHRLLRIPVGGGDEPHVDLRIGRLRTDPPHHAVLDHPKQLGLQGERHLGQLVQEEGAAVGGLQQAGLVAVGAGERALAVPEDLGLEQGLRQRRAVDRHHRLLGPTAVFVNQLGKDFFPGSAFPADEDAGVGGSDFPGQLDGFLKERRYPDQPERTALAVLFLHLLTQLAGFPVHHDRVRSPADQHLQMGCRERLGQVVPRPGPECLDARAYTRVAGHDHDNHVGIGLQRSLQQLQPGDLRHVQVDQQNVELPLPEQGDGFLAATGERHHEAIHLQYAGAAFPQGALVVHQQNSDPGLDLRRDRKRIPRGVRGLAGPFPAFGSGCHRISQTEPPDTTNEFGYAAMDRTRGRRKLCRNGNTATMSCATH